MTAAARRCRVHPLEHHLDDEVTFGDAAEVVLEVADLDQRSVALGEEERRPGRERTAHALRQVSGTFYES